MLRVPSAALQPYPYFDRVGVGFFFLIFDIFPIFPVFSEQIKKNDFSFHKSALSKLYSLNDFLLVRSPNRVIRSANTDKRLANSIHRSFLTSF